MVDESRDRASQAFSTYSSAYLNQVKLVAESLDVNAIEKIIDLVVNIRERQGRLFILGVGGGAGNASHAVCDFRKLAGIEAYAPTDNVSECTARTNDEGWESVFAAGLEVSKLCSKDGVFVLSVGGGNLENKISVNLVRALEYAGKCGASIMGIVGRDGGYTARVAEACVIIPTIDQGNVTPLTESYQSVIWHLIATHPRVRISEMKWESVLKTGNDEPVLNKLNGVLLK
jgi:D-sedoheptulose 7-phosphate isomerase